LFVRQHCVSINVYANAAGKKLARMTLKIEIAANQSSIQRNQCPVGGRVAHPNQATKAGALPFHSFIVER
jgi:hypothetical protein